MKNIIKILEKKQAKAVKDANWANSKILKNPKHIGYLIEWNNSLTAACIYSEVLKMLEK